jgi:hypothetical protein
VGIVILAARASIASGSLRVTSKTGLEAKRLKGLESENARLKKLLADAMLDNAALKDLLAKKW